MALEPFKISVTAENTGMVQERLFELGYSWADGSRFVKNEFMPVLLFCKEYFLKEKLVIYAMMELGEETETREITTEQFLIETNQETIADYKFNY